MGQTEFPGEHRVATGMAGCANRVIRRGGACWQESAESGHQRQRNLPGLSKAAVRRPCELARRPVHPGHQESSRTAYNTAGILQRSHERHKCSRTGQLQSGELGETKVWSLAL
jgi:hypothetical protein